MADPQISVILTSYNIAGYIEAAVQSALSQSGVTLEIIATDDASTDGTWEKLTSITDPRLKTIRLPGNGGPSISRNAAIAQATGQWLAVLDGDDIFFPGRLARLLQIAQSRNADIVIDNLLVHREEDGKEYLMFPPEFAMHSPLTLARFIDGNRLFSGGYALGYVKPLFSRAFLLRHNLTYDPAIRIGEDYQIMAQALASGAHCVIDPHAGYRYTVRKHSISHRLKLEDITRMRSGDAKLLAQFTFDKEATAAQARREKSFARAYAFTQLLEALKAKNAKAALCAIASYPSCAFMLWMPIAVRLKRLIRKELA